MVSQHFSLIPTLSVVENLIAGWEPVKSWAGLIDLQKARSMAARALEELGFSVPLDALVGDLNVGDQQRVEIARAVVRDASLVILDEPTAVLTPMESDVLYTMFRRLVDRGRGVVVVTHKLDEVRKYADKLTVLHKGELASEVDLRGADRLALVERAMQAAMGQDREAGREQSERASPKAGVPKERGSVEPVIALRDVSAKPGLSHVTLTVYPGEIVGVAGVMGNGQSELVSLLAGELVPEHGSVMVSDVAIVREDRHSEGLVLDASVKDNLLLGEHARVSRFGILQERALLALAEERRSRSQAVCSLVQSARSLSGGNQQKLVMARALCRAHRALVVAHPTRGVDAAGAREIHAEIRAAASARNMGVLVIGPDVEELRALSTRLVVLAGGRIVAELPPSASAEQIGAWMLGIASAAQPAAAAS